MTNQPVIVLDLPNADTTIPTVLACDVRADDCIVDFGGRPVLVDRVSHEDGFTEIWVDGARQMMRCRNCVAIKMLSRADD